MIPVGYLAKKTCKKPEGFRMAAVDDVYSVSGDVNEDFADYIDSWKHNGYWLFDSPEIISELAARKSVDLSDSLLFYYEAYEEEFTGDLWRPFAPSSGMETNVEEPVRKRQEGFDVVTFFAGNSPECSPLSCNGLAEGIRVNRHCLLESFEEARDHLNSGGFSGGEAGPYRIFAVYSVDWP
jgi:hypothetical protein